MGIVRKEEQRKILTVCAAGIGVYVGFQYLFPLISPFLLAFCIVCFLNPWLNRMQKRTRIRKELLLALTLILAAAAALGILAALLQYAAGQAGALVENWDGISGQVGGQLQIFFGDCCMFMEEHFGLDAGKVEQVILERAEIFIEELRVELVPNLMKESWWYGKKLISAAAFLGVSFIAALLLCRDYDGLMRRLGQKTGPEAGKSAGDSADNGMDPDGSEEGILSTALKTAERIFRLAAAYIKAQALILLVIMGTACALLWLGRVKNALVLGFFAGILDALPFIGTGIILIPTALWQLVNGRPGLALWCLAVYMVCMGEREFLEPKLMGKRTGIYPVFMLLSVYAGVKLFGLSGILKGPLSLVVLLELFGRKERRS
ncbi:MAG TPA: AI-2E family transporter [Candidatus Eisenbergiella pullistercoris]|uniref:AI-2E family transporter n=1 Tax=Candidatus Eisenbergiella pullistercoris TaxID=2838555 RepID=A0A9D1YNV5_9FIRM|nr:AI-2E family transporter [Candidatus Eisenbergiella pullistercoris]